MARGIMSEYLFNKILDDVRQHIPPFRVAVLYHGGEPLLNPLLPKMIGDLKSAGMPAVKIVSNGMHLTATLAYLLASSGLDAIEISLDGESADESDSVRTRSSAREVLSNILNLLDIIEEQKRGPRVTISTTQFRKDAGSSTPSIPRWLKEPFQGRPVNFKAAWAIAWPSGKHDRALFDIVGTEEHIAPTSCSLLEDTLTIRSDGTVVPCCYDLTSEAPLGNVFNNSIIDIWNSAEYKNFRKDFARGDYPRLCSGCAVVTGPRFLVPRNTPILPLQ